MPTVNTANPPPYVTPNSSTWATRTLGAATAPFNFDTDSETIGLTVNTVLIPRNRINTGFITINLNANNISVICKGLYKSIGLKGSGAGPLPCVSTTDQDSGATNIRI